MAVVLVVVTFAGAVHARVGGTSEVPPEPAPTQPPPEISREIIESVIAQGVEGILKCQQEDGPFVLGTHPDAQLAAIYRRFPVGQTALAVMSLQYARPHLKGELRDRTFEAIRKGLAFLKQQPPERLTYSAGTVICALFNEDPDRNKRRIAQYATLLITSQCVSGSGTGQWGYQLVAPTSRGTRPLWPIGRTDNSNTQFALLGLYYASRAGLYVPTKVWKPSRDHYVKSQAMVGGWAYSAAERSTPYANMTLAGTISLGLCNEMVLSRQKRRECKPPRRSKAIDNGLKWIAENWEKQKVGTDTYGLYALERLGILMGRSQIGGHDWYDEGIRKFFANRKWASAFGTGEVSMCFGVMFLARGLEPIVINKLERRDTDDWNNTPYEIKHLVEYIQDHYQLPVQWRIVTLEAPMKLLQRTPILYVSGHHELDFNEAEREKLKAYVTGGGTILGQACCGRKAFDKSFHAFVGDVFGAELKTLPKTHPIYGRMKMRALAPKPRIEVLRLDDQGGRPGIIYLPKDHCNRWHAGGERARSAYAVGTGIYFYVTTEARRMYERTRR